MFVTLCVFWASCGLSTIFFRPANLHDKLNQRQKILLVFFSSISISGKRGDIIIVALFLGGRDRKIARTGNGLPSSDGDLSQRAKKSAEWRGIFPFLSLPPYLLCAFFNY